jgi:multidrug efflux pump subunit AcrB
MQKPLAIAIITGLLAGVPLILIFTPTLLARLSTPVRERRP